MPVVSQLQALFQPVPAGQSLLLRIILAVVVSAIVFALLHRNLGPRGRRWLISVVTFVAGLFFGLEYFYPVRAPEGKNFLTDWIPVVSTMVAVIAAFTVGLGVFSLCQVHGTAVAARRPGWHNSIAFFVAMIAMLAFGLWDHYRPLPVPPPERVPWHNGVYDILFNGLFVPLQATTFSLLAFYIASAAYRAFRIRSAEAALMMVAAFVVMLGQVPVGEWLTSGIAAQSPWAFFRIERLGAWIMQWLNMPAQRGILFGIAVGALAMSLRVWLSLERGTFFSEQE